MPPLPEKAKVHCILPVVNSPRHLELTAAKAPPTVGYSEVEARRSAQRPLESRQT